MTREELYELVWERAVTRVVADLGISDVGLTKICRKHNIPTPSVGYWARLASDKQITRPPLPPKKTETPTLLWIINRPKFDLPEEIKAQRTETLTSAHGSFATLGACNNSSGFRLKQKNYLVCRILVIISLRSLIRNLH